MKDPIVEEVRKHRMEHTRKFKGNLAAICASSSRHPAEPPDSKVVRLC